MIDLIKSGEKKKILAKLDKQFGLKELPYALFRLGKERINGYSGNLGLGDIMVLAQVANIERVGLYLFKEDELMRLGFDATQLLGDKLTEGVFDINDEQVKGWMAGEDLNIKAPQGILVIKHKEDYLGCAKSNGEKIINHVPKERRIIERRNRNI